jgi:hypothetical protein
LWSSFPVAYVTKIFWGNSQHYLDLDKGSTDC